jgi:hypothetical protein
VKRLGLLIGGSLFLWAVLAYPGWYLQGDLALFQSSVALALCLIPAVATYIWAARAFRGSPQTQALAMFGGSGFRMFLVLGVGYGLMLWRSDWFSSEFWIWVLIFYLAILALEVWILVQISEAKDASDGPSAAP